MLAVWIMSYLFCFLAGCNFVAFALHLKKKREDAKETAELQKKSEELTDFNYNRLAVL